MWQQVKLSEQICPWDTLACCRDVKQPTNKTSRDTGLHSPTDSWFRDADAVRATRAGHSVAQIAAVGCWLHRRGTGTHAQHQRQRQDEQHLDVGKVVPSHRCPDVRKTAACLGVRQAWERFEGCCHFNEWKTLSNLLVEDWPFDLVGLERGWWSIRRICILFSCVEAKCYFVFVFMSETCK